MRVSSASGSIITLACAIALLPAAGTATGRSSPDRATPNRSEVPVIRVNADSTGHRVTPFMTGVNQRFYRRGTAERVGETSQRLILNAASGSPDSGVLRQIRKVGISLLRYPGGTAGHFFDWTKAIGPESSRGCQINGKRGGPVSSSFGPDEQQQLVEAAGAETQIMVPFLRGTAPDAADWVEYMNNPVSGPNINGGVDWAARRAANGHPAPYGVTRWEVGNEPFFQVNRRWLPSGAVGTPGYARAMRIYTLGGTVTQLRQLVGKQCNHRAHSAVITGTAARQTFRVYYPPVKPFASGQDQRIWVGGRWDSTQHTCVTGELGLGTSWREVPDLGAAGPQEHVYTFDNQLGKIRFGSGREVEGEWKGHGLIPPVGSCVWAEYRSGPHDGFRSYYYAMKQVDAQIKASNIDVCSAWGRSEWPRFAAMDRAGPAVRYDCLISHPYRILQHQWSSATEGYAEQMVGRGIVNEAVKTLAHSLEQYTPNAWDAYLGVSEYGFIAGQFAHQPQFPTWRNSMMRALYNTTQLVDLMDLGVRWAEGGMLLTDDAEGVISGPPHYFYSAHARGFQIMKPMLAARGHTVHHRVIGNRIKRTDSGSYPVLVTTASKSTDGDVFVLVINRDPRKSVTARIAPEHFQWTSRAQVWRMNAPSYRSMNTAQHPDRVHLSKRTSSVGRKPFRMTFGAHSITLIKLDRLRKH